MCAVNNPEELEKLRRRTKPIRAWKVLCPTGKSTLELVPPVSYGPGQVKAKGVTRETRYDVSRPRGLHVYRRKRDAEYFPGLCVPVYIDPKDIIAAELALERYAELATCRLTIRPENWAGAGLPKRATRKRYI